VVLDGGGALYEPGTPLTYGLQPISVTRAGGGRVEAHRLLYHSTLGMRVIKKKRSGTSPAPRPPESARHLTVLYKTVRYNTVRYKTARFGFQTWLSVRRG